MSETRLKAGVEAPKNFGRRTFLTTSAAVTASLCLPQPLRSETFVRESRVLFDEGFGWTHSKKVELVLERVRNAGFNTYICCLWHGRGAMWPSQIGPWWTNTDLINEDPFERLLRAAARFEIEVNPCFTLMLRQRDFLPEFVGGTGTRKMFDVHKPEFRSFMADLVLESITRYGVKGVNLDYIRAGQVCWDPFCKADYRAMSGHELMADLSLRQLGDIEADQRIVDWQRRDVRALLKEISDRAHATRPDFNVNADVAPLAHSVLIEGQDSLAWIDDGLLDIGYSMNYKESPDWTQLEELRDKMKHPNGLSVMVGNFERVDGKVVPRDALKVNSLLERARSFNRANNFGLYLYSMLSNEQIRVLSRGALRARPSWGLSQ